MMISSVCGPMRMRGNIPLPPCARCGRIRAILSYAYGPHFTSLNYTFIYFYLFLFTYIIIYFIIFYDAITSIYI